MNSPKISVIIPFYNAGRFLDRTLRNIAIEQFVACANDFWEIIVIDDGSTDNGSDKVQVWVDRYPTNIKLLHQKNLGVSVARNEAIEIARGEYLYFFDADDLLMANTLPSLVEIADSIGADMMRFLFREINSCDYHDLDVGVSEVGVIESSEISCPNVRDFFDRTKGLLEYQALWSVWSSFFRREFIQRNHLRFVEGLHIGEDEIFMWSALMCNPRLTIINRQLHLYHVHSNNATNDKSIPHIRRRAEALTKLVKYKQRILSQHNDLLSSDAIVGLNQTTAYEYQDLITYRIALGCSWQECFMLIRDYRRHLMFGRPHRHTFSNPSINSSKRAKRMAWIASKVFYNICRMVPRN